MSETLPSPSSSPSPSASAPFNPPTAEQVQAHLEANHPQPRPTWKRMFPLGVLIFAVLAMVLIRHPAAGVLPWLALAGLAIAGMKRLRRTRQLERELNSAGEQIMLRRLPQAMGQSWTLIPQLVYHPSMHGRTAAILGHSLDDLGAHEAALTCYDHLLGGLPEGGPATLHIKVTRAICALRTDRLIEADDAIRKLRGAIEPYRLTPIGAAYRFAELLQDVQTQHYADALEFRDNLLEELRPLGVEAGFGHALMALCCRHARTEDQTKANTQQDDARMWWGRATTLLPRGALIHSFPELKSFDH